MRSSKLRQVAVWVLLRLTIVDVVDITNGAIFDEAVSYEVDKLNLTGRLYYFQVAATNGEGTGDYSTEDSATPAVATLSVSPDRALCL